MAHKAKARKKREQGQARKCIRKLEADLFYLWEYICTEGLAEEAGEYLMENADRGIPFDFE